MAAVLSATHVLRRFILFALTLLFLLTMLRAGHALWHYAAVSVQDRVPELFVQGLRVDLALVGLLLLPVVVLAPLAGLFDAGRWLGRALIAVLLTVSVVGVLLGEYITPSVLLVEGVRPDLQVLATIDDASGFVVSSLRAAPIPALLGAVLIALVVIAFLARLDASRLLTRRLSVGSALALSLLGGLACVAALWSGIPGVTDPLTLPATRITDAPLVNELVLNTAWKALYTPMIEPVLSVLSSVPSR